MTVDLELLGRLADINLAGSWNAFARLGGGRTGRSDTCTFAATGLPMAFFNGAFVAGEVDDPDRVVADAIGFFAEIDVPWLLWVRESVDDALVEAGRRAGLEQSSGPPVMAMAPIPDMIPAAADGLTVATATDTAAIEVFRDLAARGFGMPREIGDRIVSDAILDDPNLAAVLGTVGGEPVSCALVSVTGTTAGIYNVATPEEYRRRGYGAALTWAAIEEGARRGCDHTILQASEMGAPVYRAMGYVDIGTYVQLAGPPR